MSRNIRDEIADLLAAKDGQDRSSRLWGTFQYNASMLLSKHQYAPPADTSDKIDALLAEAYEMEAARRAEQDRIATERRAWIAAERAEAAKAFAPPDGHLFLHLRDETDGKIYRLTLPVDAVRCMSTT